MKKAFIFGTLIAGAMLMGGCDCFYTTVFYVENTTDEEVTFQAFCKSQTSRHIFSENITIAPHSRTQIGEVTGLIRFDSEDAALYISAETDSVSICHGSDFAMFYPDSSIVQTHSPYTVGALYFQFSR